MSNEIIEIKAGSIEDVRKETNGMSAVKLIPKLEERAKSLSVRSEESSKEAGDLLKEAKDLRKNFEGIAKSYTEPHKIFAKSVNNFIHTFTDRISEKIESLVREKRNKYLFVKIAREREAQRKIELANKERQKKDLPEKILKPVTQQVKSETSTAYVRKDWVYEIIDEGKLPREYLMKNEPKITSAVRAGIRKIDGVRIYEKETIRDRG